ncbi:gas vesicle protein [Bifidobacterium catenulatum]|nr:gas vesicle protein [Bifidobacterium catenulatum]
MASDYVDDFLRDERESFKRKETAAKKFDNRLDNFRKSAQALRDAARQFEEAFPGMSRTMIADKLAMTGTEKNIAFDAKGELVAAPGGRKPSPPNPNRKPSPNRIRRRPDPKSRRRTTSPHRRSPQPNPTPRTMDGPHGRPATTDDRT